MDEYETKCKYNIAETCCDSISLNQLLALGGTSASSENPVTTALTNTRLDYGAIRGSTTLRTNISSLYSTPSTTFPSENILITPGAIAANFLAFYALVHPGDHVICIHPTYQQLYTVPESFGASVSLWKLKEEDNWSADVGELAGLIRDNTKLIVLNNPNNPTGAVLPPSVLEGVYNLAKERGIYILCDEVYAPMFHSTADPAPPTLMSLGYKNTIITGSMSKAYSLAGIRLGWVASWSKDLVELMASARDYNTISVSKIDDAVAAYAMGGNVRTRLVQRNIELCEANLKVLDAFVKKYEKYLGWVKPTAGTTAFIKVRKADGEVVDDVKFCEKLAGETGVMFVPGGLCFGTEAREFRGYVRVGYACKMEGLVEGLGKLGEWIEEGGIEKL
ncbi:hypothetical protein ABW19_dt0200848 [Dactylella cylindrospora]|nr:hypothetical protein ABW19_dt0200848 [Dactylella cylindrospora]